MEITRRRFLQGAGAFAGALVLESMGDTKLVRAAEDFPGNPNRFGMLTDTTMCIGCRMCEVACSIVMGVPGTEVPLGNPSVFETRRRPNANELTVVNRYPNPREDGAPIYRKSQCMHCNEPACVSACLVGALKKTGEGNVLYSEKLCIGCRYCMVACPFGSLGYEYLNATSPRVKKCTMCYQRVINEGVIPACAQVCPPKATIFGKRSELIDLARERGSDTTQASMLAISMANTKQGVQAGFTWRRYPLSKSGSLRTWG